MATAGGWYWALWILCSNQNVHSYILMQITVLGEKAAIVFIPAQGQPSLSAGPRKKTQLEIS